MERKGKVVYTERIRVGDADQHVLRSCVGSARSEKSDYNIYLLANE